MRAGVLLCACGLLVAILLYTIKPVFGTYWASGTAAAHGVNPYDANPLTPRSHFFALGQNHTVTDLNLNPPILLPLLQVMSHLNLTQFGTVWTIGSALFLIASIGLIIWNHPAMQLRQILWLGLSSAVFDTISSGQIYFLLLLLATLAWVCAETKREFAASIAIGFLVALKPTTAFWPFFLFLSGRRRLCLRSLCVTALTSILPLALYGPIVYRQWIGALGNDQHWIIPTDIAIPAYFARLGLKSFGMGLAGVVTAWLAYTVWKRKPSLLATSGIALCATILCAPLAWSAYILMLAPVFVARRWSKMETTAALFLMMPSELIGFVCSSGSRMGLVAGGTPYFIAVWLILISFLQITFQDKKVLDPAITACRRYNSGRLIAN
jgi:hypothetical protein